jgi:serine/threonine protein kinase
MGESEHAQDRLQFMAEPKSGGFSRSSFLDCKWERNIEDVYEFKAHLGKGGMGQVRLAVHRRTGHSFAVKIVEKSRVEDAEALQRELKFLKVIDHPNVVRFHETYQDDTNLYLVMEHCEGDDLMDELRQRRKDGNNFREEELVQLATQMLRSVAYCHAHSIVHRDIKPANFIGLQSLKLVDFGVSGVAPLQSGPPPPPCPVTKSTSSAYQNPRRASDSFLTVRTSG